MQLEIILTDEMVLLESPLDFMTSAATCSRPALQQYQT